MKTDRELLELAANAAGYTLVWGDVYIVDGENIDCTDLPYVRSNQQDEADWYWNPLEDDGDALRLAAALKLHILHNDPGESVLWVSAVLNKTMLHGAEEFQAEDGRSDATRRAIVRAAAAIGESMP